MPTTTALLQYPHHDKEHPLKPWDFSKDSNSPVCRLCDWKISTEGYTCEECMFCVHRACAEAPALIYGHPLHTDHPLTLNHRQPPFYCEACGEDFSFCVNSFRCDDCHFELDNRCAFSTLSDRGDTQGKTPEQIKLPLHPHKLTSFSTRHDFIGAINCVICKASVEGDGYACLYRRCKFLIHMRCIPDLYYTDGTKAPRIYHRHPLKTFLGEGMSSTICVNCGSNESREFVGCASCQVFCCRDCVQVPESIQYPHHPDHPTLVLLISSLDNDRSHCFSCLVYLVGKLCYGCTSCEFFVDMRCALQVLSYCEEGTEIELSWHKHQLLLCLRTKDDRKHCSYCEDKSVGPMYACKGRGCKILIDKRCIEIEVPPILQYSHHPDHPLTLRHGDNIPRCKACCYDILHLCFSCELCAFYLHPKCAARFPTRKHSLHEHELLHLDKAPSRECNRCETSIVSSFFHCVSCDFDLHEKCMELPQVVKNDIFHWHELTLHETYVEDDSGEYYCDKCEKTRDPRMGAYVCLQCPGRWAYHIECVLPELRNVFVKEKNAAEIKRLADDIARREEEVREVETKLEKMKRELDERREKHATLTVRQKEGFITH